VTAVVGESRTLYVTGETTAVMSAMPARSVDLVMTSPPFLALRSYLPDDHPDKAKEIGQEADPATFLDTILGLYAEFGRILTRYGSVALEIGDTYAGSGGAGGDYAADGLRDGQPAFAGSGTRTRADGNGKVYRGGERQADKLGDAWPQPKSLCAIPALIEVALAYGIHPLRGTPSPAGRWLVRNMAVWCRPNPPVGALGDKFRPASSYVIVATRAPDRWFDLDAVRTRLDPATGRTAGATAGGRRGGAPRGRTGATGGPGGDSDTQGYNDRVRVSNPAGAPPNDWWEIVAKGYKGSHYAVYPTALIEMPIQAMCPRRVCLTCGEPSRRVVRTNPEYAAARAAMTEGDPRARTAQDDGAGKSQAFGSGGGAASLISHGKVDPTPVTVGWTTCGCPGTGTLWADGAADLMEQLDHLSRQGRNKGRSRAEREHIKTVVIPRVWDELAVLYVGKIDGFHPGDGWRPGHVLDPFGGSGTTGVASQGIGRSCTMIDLDERNADQARDRLGMFVEFEVHETANEGPYLVDVDTGGRL
jgi:hypothetical protein